MSQRLGLILTIFFSLSAAAEFRLVHFNIKELDSTKILQAHTEEGQIQVHRASDILKEIGGDIISINEIQFDLPDVPNAQFRSRGSNLHAFAKKFLSDIENYFFIFNAANTGALAQRNSHGEYVIKPTPAERLALADPINFGLFPGQYSTGAITKFAIQDQKVIRNLQWKQFRPNRDLSLYKDAKGQALPEDMPLFDKNFTHSILLVNGRPLHLILLHAVPAFHFGNNRSPNYVRNLDQLEFLRWYLGGTANFAVPQNFPLQPLPKNAQFVAMGDWNVDAASNDPGAKIIRQLGSEFKFWQNQRAITFHGSDFAPNSFKAQLDYILLSRDLIIKDSGTYLPAEDRVELGCEEKLHTAAINKRIVKYKTANQTCFAEISETFYFLKQASDHIPLWADIEFAH